MPETSNETEPKRNWAGIIIDVVSATYVGKLVLESKFFHLAGDLLARRKSSEVFNGTPLIAARDRIAEQLAETQQGQGWWKRSLSKLDAQSSLAKEVAKENIGWIESLKKQSWTSRIIVAVLAYGAVRSAYDAISELLSPSRKCAHSESPSAVASTGDGRPWRQRLTTVRSESSPMVTADELQQLRTRLATNEPGHAQVQEQRGESEQAVGASR